MHINGALSLATGEQKLLGRIDNTDIATARRLRSLPCMTKRMEVEQVLQANQLLDASQRRRKRAAKMEGGYLA